MADLHWTMTDGTTDGWVLATYTNQYSGVIGNFSYYNRGVANVTEAGSNSGDPYYIDYFQEGLTGNNVGFLKYDLGTALSSFKNGLIMLDYNDEMTTEVVPSCVMLEGTLQDGTRVLLACEIPSSGSQSTMIRLSSSSFKVVTTFFYEEDDNPTAPPRTLVYSTGDSLSNDAFAAFLETVDSIFIRNYAYEGNSGLGLVRAESYTYINELTIKPIPEPAGGVLAAGGMVLLAARRRRD